MTVRNEAQIIADEAAEYVQEHGDYAEGVDVSVMSDDEVWNAMRVAGIRLNLHVAFTMGAIGCDEDRVAEARGDLAAADDRVKAGFIAAQRAFQAR